MQCHSILVQDLSQLQAEVLQFSSNQSAQHLIQVFSTQSSDLVVEYSRLLQQRFPNATILGQSTSHCIKDGDIVNLGTLVVVTELDETRLSTCVIPYTGDQSRDGEALIEQLQITEETKAVICFAEQVDDKETLLFGSKDYQVFEAFNELPFELPVAGGLSQPNLFGRWVLCGDEIYHHACVAVALHNHDLSVWRGCFAEWNPIGRTFRITEARDGVLYKLDGVPVQQVYNRYLADGNPVPFEQLYDFPLMKGEANGQKVYVPVRQLEDGGIEFDTHWQEGDEVRFCYNHPSLTEEQVRIGAKNLRRHQPESVFIYNCSSRLDFIDDVNETRPFASAGSVNGAYCLGELYRDVNQQTIMHHSLTYLAMREHEVITNEVCEERATYQHHVSPLFSLIRNAVADVDDMQTNMEQKLLEQARRLTESYRRDRRTGLPNRSVLKERLASIRISEHLLTVKLTNFSQVNEKYGYQVGDQLLKDLSQYFKEQLWQRFGGSAELYSIGVGEWAAVFPSHHTGLYIRHLFTELVDAIEHVNFEPFGLPDLDCLSVSICGGLVSRRDFPDTSVEELLIKSIEARKHGMKNNRHMCNAKLLEKEEENRQEQLSWLASVSRAVLDHKVIAYAQPIFAAHSHAKVSQECLVRIKDGNQVIPPGKFLPIIEGTHIYTRLSRQMINHVFETMSHSDESFSINLSPQDLMSDKTLYLLESALQKMVRPERVGIEVLETEQIKDYTRMREVCNHFKGLGAKIVVDDFGSGYSNIDEIIKLEPDTIKLDGSIIRNIDKDRRQRQIAMQLVRLCHVFEARTVAEFVHNEQVCRVAEDLGVDYLQGFYLAEPSPLLAKEPLAY
ncbi:EAL domain-containing protein [Vibrio nigripulchritudo]|uniref:bifunctional diguanylate cyclase/phosphodiesterase n=1 Tax=Vibrio nigripulchritudo TaxID=28173 RepID=UPI0003B223B8|nr:EAL domain-containing protein [Vibrio nigripulchritudo]CCN71298.1 putative GGDEF family protein [Vibrio nigripulchritudo SFn118]